MKNTILSLLLTTGFCSATVTVTGGVVFDMRGETALVRPDVGDIYVIVATASNDTFENILAGDSLSVGSSVGGGDDVIIAQGTLSDAGGNRAAQAAFSGLAISTAAEPNPALSQGDHYAIVWFDGVTSTGPVSEGAIYGVARNVDWVIPPDTTTQSRSNITTTQLANFRVQPVPEPSSVALLGLGSLALLARRRKN